MQACCDRGISRAVRGSGLTGAAISLLRTGAGDSIGSTRGFRLDRSAEGAGSETDGSTGCRFGAKSASAWLKRQLLPDGRIRFAHDSLLEEAGFEPSVPR